MMISSHPCSYGFMMRDGTHLCGLLFQAEPAVGVVLLRTPYNALRHVAIGQSWAERGYHCLIQDVRGRYSSSGEWAPYQHEAVDGAETLIRLRTMFPHLPVIAFGASYAAHAALESARGALMQNQLVPERLILLVPALGLAETAWDTNGIAQIEHRIAWWHEHGIGSRSCPPLLPDELESRVRRANQIGAVAAAAEWKWPAPILERWRNLWKAERINLGTRYASIASPLLVITGSDDFFAVDAQQLAASWHGSTHFVTGPWGHGLASDLTDPVTHKRFVDSGGLGGVIDNWLRVHQPFDVTYGQEITTHFISRFDPVAGSWIEQKQTCEEINS